MDNQRKRADRGFTLAELLIVVAIIAVLVAVSIPIFTGQLEKSRQAVDVSNMRAAYAAAEYRFLEDGEAYRGYYDAASGTLTDAAPTGYGKSGKDVSEWLSHYAVPFSNASGTPNNGTPQALSVSVDQAGAVSMAWGGAGSLWASLTSRISKLDNKQEGAGNFKHNNNAYADLINIDNSERREADKDMLNAIAAQFEGISAEQAKSILGKDSGKNLEQYNRSLHDGGFVFRFGVDNTSHSARVDYPTDGAAAILENIQQGLSKTLNEGRNYTLLDDSKNYVSTYLFTSDEVVADRLGSQTDIKVKLTLSADQTTVVSARVWIDGTGLSSD
ncbi:MAG: prepilin-type N-terminal cleavage/methylation domain-containing protein [Oscillospiraceae bacterium]|nr:prepilin-type N-terminal cleavage/methylation domain-containing protein [Oscillospiraceae bacterium]